MASGIFYDPRVHDWGSQVVQGGLAGLAMARNAQDIEMNKMKMDEAKKMQAARDEIIAAHKEYEAEVQGMKKGPAGGMDETQKGMIAMDQQEAVAAEKVPTASDSPAVAGYVEREGEKPKGLAGLDAEKQAGTTEDEKAAPLHAKGQFMTKARDIFMKNGMIDQAMSIEKNYMSHVAHIGHYVSKKAALKELQSGMFKDSFDGLTASDIEDNKETWDVKNIGPNHDGIIKYNKKTGEVTVVKEPSAKEEKEDKESWTDFGYGQKKNLKTGEIVKVPTAPREGAGKTNKDEAWSISKVRQEYSSLSTNLNTQIKDMEKQLEEEDNPETRTRLAELKDARNKLNTYRSYDEDWINKGYKEPKNLYKVSDFISGFARGASTPSSQAGGKVRDESKGLLKGKYTKVLEDPKTKKRYGVKPDGTKELIGA